MWAVQIDEVAGDLGRTQQRFSARLAEYSTLLQMAVDFYRHLSELDRHVTRFEEEYRSAPAPALSPTVAATSSPESQLGLLSPTSPMSPLSPDAPERVHQKMTKLLHDCASTKENLDRMFANATNEGEQIVQRVRLQVSCLFII